MYKERQTPSDNKSSHVVLPGELKRRQIKKKRQKWSDKQIQVYQHFTQHSTDDICWVVSIVLYSHQTWSCFCFMGIGGKLAFLIMPFLFIVPKENSTAFSLGRTWRVLFQKHAVSTNRAHLYRSYMSSHLIHILHL